VRYEIVIVRDTETGEFSISGIPEDTFAALGILDFAAHRIRGKLSVEEKVLNPHIVGLDEDPKILPIGGGIIDATK
jgi:hypothetical protein